MTSTSVSLSAPPDISVCPQLPSSSNENSKFSFLPFSSPHVYGFSLPLVLSYLSKKDFSSVVCVCNHSVWQSSIRDPFSWSTMNITLPIGHYENPLHDPCMQYLHSLPPLSLCVTHQIIFHLSSPRTHHAESFIMQSMCEPIHKMIKYLKYTQNSMFTTISMSRPLRLRFILQCPPIHHSLVIQSILHEVFSWQQERMENDTIPIPIQLTLSVHYRESFPPSLHFQIPEWISSCHSHHCELTFQIHLIAEETEIEPYLERQRNIYDNAKTLKDLHLMISNTHAPSTCNPFPFVDTICYGEILLHQYPSTLLSLQYFSNVTKITFGYPKSQPKEYSLSSLLSSSCPNLMSLTVHIGERRVDAEMEWYREIGLSIHLLKRSLTDIAIMNHVAGEFLFASLACFLSPLVDFHYPNITNFDFCLGSRYNFVHSAYTPGPTFSISNDHIANCQRVLSKFPSAKQVIIDDKRVLWNGAIQKQKEPKSESPLSFFSFTHLRIECNHIMEKVVSCLSMMKSLHHVDWKNAFVSEKIENILDFGHSIRFCPLLISFSLPLDYDFPHSFLTLLSHSLSFLPHLTSLQLVSHKVIWTEENLFTLSKSIGNVTHTKLTQLSLSSYSDGEWRHRNNMERIVKESQTGNEGGNQREKEDDVHDDESCSSSLSRLLSGLPSLTFLHLHMMNWESEWQSETKMGSDIDMEREWKRNYQREKENSNQTKGKMSCEEMENEREQITPFAQNVGRQIAKMKNLTDFTLICPTFLVENDRAKIISSIIKNNIQLKRFSLKVYGQIMSFSSLLKPFLPLLQSHCQDQSPSPHLLPYLTHFDVIPRHFFHVFIPECHVSFQHKSLERAKEKRRIAKENKENKKKIIREKEIKEEIKQKRKANGMGINDSTSSSSSSPSHTPLVCSPTLPTTTILTDEDVENNANVKHSRRFPIQSPASVSDSLLRFQCPSHHEIIQFIELLERKTTRRIRRKIPLLTNVDGNNDENSSKSTKKEEKEEKEEEQHFGLCLFFFGSQTLSNCLRKHLDCHDIDTMYDYY